MRHIMFASHGPLAESLVDSAKVVCGEEMVKGIKTFSMKADTNQQDFIAEVTEYINLDPEGEYFVLTDLYGASPCISMVMALRDKQYRIVTGMNLGMVLEVLINKDVDLSNLEELAICAGKEGVKSFYIKA